jgi:hypothetical protein
MRIASLFGVLALGAALGAWPAHAQRYDNDNWSAQWAARWALDAFQPVDRVVVWRSDIRMGVVAPQEGWSQARQAQAALRELAGTIDLRYQIVVPARNEDADFVICVGEVKGKVNALCDSVYLVTFRATWHQRGLTLATPEPPQQARIEDTPVLDRCSYFTDSSRTIRAAFISLSPSDDKSVVRNCLMQGLGLSFWRIEAFFQADYTSDENQHGIKGHELSLLKAGYWVDRLGCAGMDDRQACFRHYIDRAEAELRQSR